MESIREEVLEVWRGQGLPRDESLEDLFVYDRFEELVPDLYPLPDMGKWPRSLSGLQKLKHHLNPANPQRMPSNWFEEATHLLKRSFPLFLRIHNGIFLSLGVEDWGRFTETMILLKQHPDYVHKVLEYQTAFAMSMAELVLKTVSVDAVIFSEPIASNHGPLISPKMYDEFVLPSYELLFDLVEQWNIQVVIFRSYANFRALLSRIVKRRFNCIWACDSENEAMDYRKIREEIGNEIGLIGGVDGDVLRLDQYAIQREVEEKVVPLLALGRYIPLIDGRVREDVPFENYAFYRRLIEKVCISS